MFKILVVEDDRDLNRSVCAFLNQSGYEATACLDGREVLLTHREFNLLYKLLVCMEDKKERLDRDGTRPGTVAAKSLDKGRTSCYTVPRQTRWEAGRCARPLADSVTGTF